MIELRISLHQSKQRTTNQWASIVWLLLSVANCCPYTTWRGVVVGGVVVGGVVVGGVVVGGVGLQGGVQGAA